MTSSVAFWLAGALAIVHGILGERRVIGAIRFPSAPLLILSRGMLWVSVAAWAGAGLLYIAIGVTRDRDLAAAIVVTQAIVLGISVVGNFRATRGRHPGWMPLALSIACSCYGLATLA